MVALSLSPQAIATALDIGPDTLDHWIDEGWLHTHSPMSPHRQIDLAEALRFIRQHRLTMHRPDALGLRQDIAQQLAPAEETRRLLDAFASADKDLLLQYLLARFAETHDLPAYLDGPMHAALHHCRVGLEAIHTDPQPDAQALAHATDSLRRLAATIQPTPSRASPIALCVALDDDRDPTPAALAAVVLADHGYRILETEPAIGIAAVLRAINDHPPRVVCLSVSQPTRPHRVALEQIDDLRQRLEAMRIAAHLLIPDQTNPLQSPRADAGEPEPGSPIRTMRRLREALRK